MTDPVICLPSLAVLVSAIALFSAGAQPAQRHDTDAVLAAASVYMDQYERDVSAIVAEEDYVQDAGYGRKRRLRSDFVVIRDEDFGWIEFRDVFQVDGRPVRDREQRLADLFTTPREDAVLQARRIAEEGARYNIGNLTRTINTPLVALRFLATRARGRSTFRVDRRRSRHGAVGLEFKEHSHPRMIMTQDDSPAEGLFWIDRGSGRVTATELRMRSLDSSLRIRVTFAREPRLDLWLPVTMDERYETDRRHISGRARYSNFRQFRVDARTKPPIPHP